MTVVSSIKVCNLSQLTMFVCSCLMQNDIYTMCAASLVLLLVRVARLRGSFVGKVRMHHRTSDMCRVFVRTRWRHPARAL